MKSETGSEPVIGDPSPPARSRAAARPASDGWGAGVAGGELCATAARAVAAAAAAPPRAMPVMKRLRLGPSSLTESADGRTAEIAQDRLVVEHDGGIVFGCVLDLLEVAEAAVLV